MNNHFTREARRAIAQAEKLAVEKKHAHIGTEHLLAGLLAETDGTAAIVLREQKVTREEYLALIDQYITNPVEEENVVLKPAFTPNAQRALDKAWALAGEKGLAQAGTEHLLIALLMQTSGVAVRLLTTMNINIHRLYLELLKAAGESEEEQKRDLAQWKEAEEKPSGSSTPTLDQYSRDLTALAVSGRLDPIVGRDAEISRVIEILSRRKKNNPCLIGEPGVGKTAIVEGLAERIVAGNVPLSVRGKRVVVLDLSGMVAGSKYRGEFEERIKKVISEVMNHREILLFIDEIHTMIGAGGAEGALDAANILKPSLARGEIQLIGATTITEYRKYIEKDAALERRFQQVIIEEPDAAQTLQILQELKPLYEQHHGVIIREDALEAAVKLSSRYLNDRYQPDKALDLLDEASASVQLGQYRDQRAAQTLHIPNEIAAIVEKKESAIRSGDFAQVRALGEEQMKLEEQLAKASRKHTGKRALSVTEEDIARTIASWTGIPVARITESESKRLARLESILHERVIGQDEAVAAVAKAIRRGRVGLKDPGKPNGSFLFLGPTGVGKTELSKALAEAVFGSEDAMIRVDMSEYMEKASVAKIIGSPPGYVGYEEGGQLSEKVRRHPYSVILFDEIEKAHPDVFNILLQVLDDGHITDSQGRKVSFKESIIIMTSNAGANRIVQPKTLGFSSTQDEKQNYEQMKSQVMDEVRQMFRPEFLNRIDDIQVFHALTFDHMKQIFDLLAKDLARRCKNQLEIDLRITPAAKKALLEKGLDQKYGARPIKRIIQNRIEDPLAEEILSGKIQRGSKVTVKAKKGEIIFASDEM